MRLNIEKSLDSSRNFILELKSKHNKKAAEPRNSIYFSVIKNSLLKTQSEKHLINLRSSSLKNIIINPREYKELKKVGEYAFTKEKRKARWIAKLALVNKNNISEEKIRKIVNFRKSINSFMTNPHEKSTQIGNSEEFELPKIKNIFQRKIQELSEISQIANCISPGLKLPSPCINPMKALSPLRKCKNPVSIILPAKIKGKPDNPTILLPIKFKIS